jgi:hypothetical protein
MFRSNMVLEFYYFVHDTQWVSQYKNEKKRQGVLESEMPAVCGQIPVDNVPSRYTKKILLALYKFKK